MNQELFENLFYEWLDQSGFPLSNIYINSYGYKGVISFNYYGVRASYFREWDDIRYIKSYVDIDNIDLDETEPDLEYVIDVLDNIKIIKDKLDIQYHKYEKYMDDYGHM